MKVLYLSGALAVALFSTANIAYAYNIHSQSNYSSNQEVIIRGACNDGTSFNVRYFPNNGKKYAIYNLFGHSAEDVMSKFCSNKGG